MVLDLPRILPPIHWHYQWYSIILSFLLPAQVRCHIPGSDCHLWLSRGSPPSVWCMRHAYWWDTEVNPSSTSHLKAKYVKNINWNQPSEQSHQPQNWKIMKFLKRKLFLVIYKGKCFNHSPNGLFPLGLSNFRFLVSLSHYFSQRSTCDCPMAFDCTACTFFLYFFLDNIGKCTNIYNIFIWKANYTGQIFVPSTWIAVHSK